jgi:GTP-binding protein
MAPPLRLEFVTSAPGVEHLPTTRAEVALVGRSNVGKSSLLNALAGRRELAHTSKTPGRTQLLNCYRLDDGLTVVDCPGYGYASASKASRAAWRAMVEAYLLDRPALAMTLVLVDGEVGPTKLDVAMLGWLRDHDVPFTVVATKHDKVKAAQREKRKQAVSEGCGVARSDIVWVSAAKGTNVDQLRGLVRGWLGATSG